MNTYGGSDDVHYSLESDIIFSNHIVSEVFKGEFNGNFHSISTDSRFAVQNNGKIYNLYYRYSQPTEHPLYVHFILVFNRRQIGKNVRLLLKTGININRQNKSAAITELLRFNTAENMRRFLFSVCGQDTGCTSFFLFLTLLISSYTTGM